MTYKEIDKIKKLGLLEQVECSKEEYDKTDNLFKIKRDFVDETEENYYIYKIPAENELRNSIEIQKIYYLKKISGIMTFFFVITLISIFIFSFEWLKIVLCCFNKSIK